MNVSTLLRTSLAAGLFLTLSATAQETPVGTRINDRAVMPSKENTSRSVPRVSAEPPTLGGNAMPTGLSGFYDYQSNGGSPGRIRVAEDADEIHVTYMLSTDGTNETTIDATRRVGYAVSTDGGESWEAIQNIAGIESRFGYPYLQIGSEGPLVSMHGNPDNQGGRCFIYTKVGETFFEAADLPTRSAAGRAGSGEFGVIWSAFVVDPADPLRMDMVGSLFIGEEEAPAPLQAAKVDLNTGSALGGTWLDLGDSLATASAGGRYVIARSPEGKVGIAYRNSIEGSNVEYTGLYLIEREAGSVIWNEPVRIFGGDYSGEDTLTVGSNVDFTYRGEEPFITFTGSLNNLYREQKVYFWSPSTGITTAAFTDLDNYLGLDRLLPNLSQPGTAGISYPAIAVEEDGEHVMIVFTAMGQRVINEEPFEAEFVASGDGFGYLRLWGVGSPDGGKTWGDPFVLQDWGGDDRDSASIEYPMTDKVLRTTNDGNFELSMAFQARRFPGMYSFVANLADGTEADRGPINECFLYFQRAEITPDMFRGARNSADDPVDGRIAGASMRAFPNPAGATATLEYALAASGDVSLSIYNMMGEIVAEPLREEHRYTGTHTVELDLKGLPEGAYRCVMTQDGKVTSCPIRIIR